MDRHGVLLWVLPPLLGAAIGYITNAIAISMLFRPHEVKRLFGIKLPLTPGIIPKERFELSLNVGRLVSKELLTEDAVFRQISSSSFRDNAAGSISKLVNNLLSVPAGKPGRFLLDGLKMNESGADSESGDLIVALINSFLSSEGFNSFSRNMLSSALGYVASRTPSELLGGDIAAVRKIVYSVLDSKNRDRFSRLARSVIEKGIHDNFKLYMLLSPKTADSLGKAGVRIYELLFPEIVRWLKEEGTKKELEIRGRLLLKDIFYKLNRIQRFLLSAAQYDKTLEENMGAIVDDLVDIIERDGSGRIVKEKLFSVITSSLKRFSQMSLGEIISAWDGNFWEDYEKAETFILDRLFSDGFKESVSDRIISFIEDHGSVAVGDLISSLINVEKNTFIESFSRTLIPDDMNWKKFASGILSGMPDHETLTLKDLLGLEDDFIDGLIVVLTDIFLVTLERKIPDILESIDVQSLVVDKIDSLDIEKIEDLILEIVKKQLRWINLFGALLGALIGTVQLLLNLSMR